MVKTLVPLSEASICRAFEMNPCCCMVAGLKHNQSRAIIQALLDKKSILGDYIPQDSYMVWMDKDVAAGFCQTLKCRLVRRSRGPLGAAAHPTQS